MKIGVLLCDDVHPDLQKDHGNYPEMFTTLFEQVDNQISLTFYRVIDGQYPQSLDECDGYISSGSKFSVYDQNRWISTFQAFVHQLYTQHIPFVGICFGHQMIAWALGGEVMRSDKGWGIGIKEVEINTAEIDKHSWLTPALPSFSLVLSHQDQVTGLPDNTTVLAGSAFCPNAMILVGKHFLGIQGHPEFTPEYSHGLMKLRHALYPKAVYEKGQQSLHQPTQHLAVTQWIVNFIKSRVMTNALL
ncbi:GMP synthase [Photobacterium sanctipauli]|uniref:GMP synthase n=1 Tax=Photobacterium sanctipauli TaxID=1342794 RepID=A0A2T3NWL1_9GAMM|nr:gamma-glutamyl-gamma-aminobutyrate hydrolase family protein [Photobacterium sanctipauli]PSW20622.1 GMP synthase [Photobacterium sanctipauli]